MIFFMIAFLSYLLGSIPFGFILSKASGKGDIRHIGSGSIGATNVLRTGKKYLAAATLLLDLFKGTAAVYLAFFLFSESYPLAPYSAGFFVFLGHLFPVWLHFKGGKGVATYYGLLLAFSWKIFLVFAVIWLIAARLWRYSSVSSLISVTLTPVGLYFFDSLSTAIFFLILTVFIWERHRDNIQRLILGQETKIKFKKH